MPLLDHFHPPLSERRHWHAFHNAWATYIASALNERLPPGYFAEPNVQFGIEIDVATFEESAEFAVAGTSARSESSSLLSEWTPPEPVQTVPFTIATDQVEVLVFNREAGPVLAGAIELVSPANKDRQEHRDAFASKCVTYLHQGVGLIVIDIVTERGGNLHNELMARLLQAESWTAELYAVAYRAVKRNGGLSLDIWPEELAVGRPLPTLPLWLRGGLSLPVELEATYERTCREQRVITNVG